MSSSFSPTRTKAQHKPRVAEGDLAFFASGSSLAMQIGSLNQAAKPNDHGELMLPCCETESAATLPILELDRAPGVTLEYSIEGGFNSNAIFCRCSINQQQAELQDSRVIWVALKTFTGFQFKYVTPNKYGPIKFALADEDAFVYCNKQPCEECGFRCKRGFILYAAISGVGVIRLPLDRVSMLPSFHQSARDFADGART